jgi:glutamyl/glutaminyl-tRNA synthetase
LASLVKEFSLERVQKGGAVFNIKRLHFLNGFYIRQKPLNKLTELCLPYLIKAGLITELMDEFSDNKNKNDKSPETFKLFQEGRPQFRVKETGEIIDFAYLEKITGLYQERLKESSEIVNLIDFFFKEKLEYEKKLLIWKEMTDKELKTTLKKLAKILSKIKPEDWNKNNLEHILMKEAEALSPVLQPQGNTSAPPDKQVGYYKVKDRGYLLWPLRVALTGKQASAPPFDIAEVLGKEKTLKRIREALGKR